MYLDTTDAERTALAQRIRTVVEAIGTQEEAADAAEISAQQIRNLISGRSAPSLLPISRLAVRAGYDLNWITTGKGEPKRADGGSVAQDVSKADFAVTAQLAVLIDMYEGVGAPFDDRDPESPWLAGRERVFEFDGHRELWPQIAAAIIDAHRRAIRQLRPRDPSRTPGDPGRR